MRVHERMSGCMRDSVFVCVCMSCVCVCVCGGKSEERDHGQTGTERKKCPRRRDIVILVK